MAIHDQDAGIFRRQVRHAGLHTSTNVANAEVTGDAAFLVRPKATWHCLIWLAWAGSATVWHINDIGRSCPSEVDPPMPVPSPPPLLTRHPPASFFSALARTLLLLDLPTSVVSFVRHVSSMEAMRPGLVIFSSSL
eukprot:CAMPEP_0174722468 /NCGR_PEP_ID=MMETSP1094-20130205/38543_1 /TAXON_ID=156173 /ORGANISM="Chrysochromulina brevifilum, Strain UTEX LB 985" /LENGTH=135 /DNA_ID=CAMNT_0015923335 /DNA_START=1047 /DNA_END=1454 /DNA_ORIENTATION=+